VEQTHWVAVVPVKAPQRAKSRLGPDLATWRTDLATAFAIDTLAALVAASRIELVVVVGGEGLSASTLDHPRVRTLRDPGDLNAAARHGIEWTRQHHPDAGILILTADLPAATATAIDALLVATSSDPVRVLPDLEGSGSTGLLIGPGADADPAFGGASLARHRTAGATVVDLPGIDGLRRDVDTAGQLAEAVRLGVGPRTRSVIAEMADADR
jgi:2-phospho-L-lactate/phosphoenolpyruvate guanylyltransferase